MQDIHEAFLLAIGLITSGDAGLWQVILLSLQVSLSAALLGCAIGIPLAAFLAVVRFPGRAATTAVLNALMGLPPVVVGLTVYLLLSRAGPLGALGLLYSVPAMIIAQTVLVTPLIAALARQIIADVHEEYDEFFRSLGLERLRIMRALIWDARFSLVTVALAGFGRAIAEVGAVIIVGGNINHATRVMTTTIALETSKGNLAVALALGVVLLTLAVAITSAVMALRGAASRMAYA
jgi:tungstate transport system permease protein